MEELAESNLTPFATMYSFFDETVIGIIQTGTASMITLITPLVEAGFGIYMILILSSYWRGSNEDHVTDFLMRMVGWGLVITIGLNFNNYLLYVVPFINGLGDELAMAVGTKYNSAAALDTMFAGIVNALIEIMKASTVSTMFMAATMCLFMIIVGGIFMVIAVGYIIMAKLALGILIAIGPLFIAAALFPATRKLFESWVAQCLNYAFLTMLFSFAAQLQINMLTKLIPSDYSLSKIYSFEVSCIVMIFVSLNLPGIASSLAGGVGLSANAAHNLRHGKQLAEAAGKAIDHAFGYKRADDKQQPEQK